MCWDVLVEFDHQKEDVLGSSDGLVLEFRVYFVAIRSHSRKQFRIAWFSR